MIKLDFSSLVLMEKDKDTNILIKELGSYEVNEGAEYITKMYSIDDVVSVYFSTLRDVEEWEYSAIYDVFNEEAFSGKGFAIEFDDEEFNPTWYVTFDYIEDYSEMKDKLNLICNLIKEEMERTDMEIQGKEDKYK